MNDQELQENFYMACLKYAMDNGSVPDIDAFIAQRLLDEEAAGISIPALVQRHTMDDLSTRILSEEQVGISIAAWTHSSTPPTTTDLKAYSVSDLDEVKLIYTCIDRMRQGKTCVCTTPIATILLPYADEGQLRYCQTDTVLKIKLNDAWVTL